MRTEGLANRLKERAGLNAWMGNTMKKCLMIILAAAMMTAPMMFTASVYAQEKAAGGTETKAADTVKPEKKAVKKAVKHHKKHAKKAHKAKAAKEPAKAIETTPAGK